MLTRIHLKNFKLHADTSIDAAPITVFIGPNSSGKSSIFQSLLLWRQAAARNTHVLCTTPTRSAPSDGQPYLFTPDQLIDIGEFDQVVRRGERDVTLTIEGDVPRRKSIEYGPGSTNGSFEIRVRDNQLISQRGKLAYEIKQLDLRRQGEWFWIWGQQGKPFALQLLDLNLTLQINPAQSLAMLGNGSISGTGAPSPEQGIALQELIDHFVRAPRSVLESMHPVFPLRGFEEVGYPLAEPTYTLDRMALQDRTIALLSALAHNRDLERGLSMWLADLLDIRIETKLLSGKRVTILCSPARREAMSSLFSNEGTGAQQLAFVLVPVGLTPPGETILLSEPEVHLHPRLQAHLTRLFVQLARRERRQFFIETHSEHVLHALLNSVAKRELLTSELAIYYFEGKDGVAAASRLQIDETGGVAGGLPGFFDQSLGELTEYLGALKSK